MLITAGSLICLFFCLVVYIINESEGSLYILHLVVGDLCCIYCLLDFSYVHCKKKIEELNRDLDQLFDRQNKLLERISVLTHSNNNDESP